MSLREFVINNPKLVKMAESKRYPGLYVLKYTRKVFYDNLWNEYLEECRGAVVDKDFNVVIRPFTKIYNRHERGTDISRDELVTGVQKINGFMAGATYVPQYGKVIVSTTGSLDSEFVDMAETYITQRVKDAIVSTEKQTGERGTWLFEISHPNDPHIIKELNGAYLIGLRKVADDKYYRSDANLEFSLDWWARNVGVNRPAWSCRRFSDFVSEVKICRHEGFVVYGDKTVLKMKSPYYLITKFFARIGVDRLLRTELRQLKETIDEEYYGLADFVFVNREKFSAMTEQDRIKFIEEYFEGVVE